MREYKEDSTKGRALVRPRSYKGDSLVQAWIDRRKLAMLSIWLDKGGYNTIHMSELLKFTIDEVVESLIANGVVEKIEFTADAEQIMKKYRTNLNPGERGLRNLHHNLVLDEIRKTKSFEGEIEQVPRGDSEVERIRKKTREDIEKYKRMMERGEVEDIRSKRSKEQAKEQMNEAYKDPRIVKIDDEVIVDVEKNMAKAKANDEKLKDMP